MALHRTISLVIQYVLLFNVHISKCEFNPPGVGLCPTGEHDLEPCKCISMSHKMDGLISIDCGPSTHWTNMDEIKNMFNSVDEYPTTHVYRFNMTGTNVTGTLNQDIWGPLDFHQIVMDNNKIRIVDDYTFSNSSEMLTQLSLKNNEITYFHWNNLKELIHLNQLVLQGNNLSYIPGEVFPQTDIAYLDLSRNTISYVGQYAFDKLHKLRMLNLSHNELQTLDDDMFCISQYNPDLQIILSNNNISKIRPGAFPNIHSELIDLRNNSLKTVDEEVFMPIVINNIDNSISIFLTGNPIVCDCGVFWILRYNVKKFFSNFGCYDIFGNPTGVTFEDLGPSFFNNCTMKTNKYRGYKKYAIQLYLYTKE